MIENIYSNTVEKEEEYQASGRKPPKNVRQAGYFTGDLRIYVEDYVHTFTHWLAEQDYSKRCLAVLVGEFAKSKHSRDVYAYGTVVAEGACTDSGIEMTSEIWTQIYETIKGYFSEGEIVGWFYGGTSFTEEEKEMLSQVHLDYFAGTDRILMLYDFLEREEEFYRYEGEGLVRQSGYYIYYEKNTEMQNYMIDKKQGKNVHEEIEDRAVREVRARLGVNTPAQPKRESGGRAGSQAGSQGESQAESRAESQAESRGGKPGQADLGGSKLLYVAGIVVAAVAVITGASMLYNQERMKGFEQTLNQIMSAVRQDGEKTPGQKGDTENKNAKNTDAENGNTETADGSHGSIFDDPKTQETFQNDNKSGNEPSENPSSKDSQEDGKNSSQMGTQAQDAAGSQAGEKDPGGEGDSGEKDGTENNDGPDDGKNSPGNNSAPGSGQKDGSSDPGSTDASGGGAGEEGDTGKGGNAGEEGNAGEGGNAGEEGNAGEGGNAGEEGSEEEGNAGEENNSEQEGSGAAEASQGTDGFLDSSSYTVYTVRPGDTLVGICMRMYGSIENLDYIKTLNQINNENLIYADQELLLP